MLKKLSSLLLCSVAFFSFALQAKEPANIALAKQKVERYYDSGQYLHDISDSLSEAMRYLELRVARKDFNGKKPAIVLDIDETSLSNYPDMRRLDFGGTIQEIRQDEDKGIDDAIAPTLKLYRYAQENHIAVFFITGRFEEERKVTEDNLLHAGYLHYDGLVLRDGDFKKAPAAVYKSTKRKELTDKGYEIVLNIGDQKSDLNGGYADKTVKLPNPFYYIP